MELYLKYHGPRVIVVELTRVPNLEFFLIRVPNLELSQIS